MSLNYLQIGTFIQSYGSGPNKTYYKWNMMNIKYMYQSAIKKLNNINNLLIKVTIKLLLL